MAGAPTEHLVFVDVETTGLDSSRHEIVELAWARDDGPVEVVYPRHTLRFAEPIALQVNRYHERGLGTVVHGPDDVSGFLLQARGNTLVAANPTFDATFLKAHFGWAPWHYRLLDIESYAAGVLGWDRPPSLKDIREQLTGIGYDIPAPDHTAAGDVTALRACWRALRAERPYRGSVVIAA
ncbi:MAG: 3'-5' exonuclease [Mycobacterium sp.]